MTASRSAADTGKVRMAELTGGEARALLADNPVILIPLGSHEDQGPHAPMGDYLSADAVAEAIARRATAAGIRTLVAPVLPFGGADYFGTMPGGIALGQETLKAVLTDMFACLLRHKLDRLIVVNGHGGNVDAVHQTTLAIRREHGVTIPSLYLWAIAYGLLRELLGEKAARSAGHGADPLTSVTMHFFPDLIRPDLIAGPPPQPKALGLDVSDFGTVRFNGANIHVPLELDTIAPNGVWEGDPRLCSADTGAALAERLTALGADFIRYFVAVGD